MKIKTLKSEKVNLTDEQENIIKKLIECFDKYKDLDEPIRKYSTDKNLIKFYELLHTSIGEISHFTREKTLKSIEIQSFQKLLFHTVLITNNPCLTEQESFELFKLAREINIKFKK